MMGPVKANALYGRMLTKLAISYCLRQKPTTAKSEWNVIKIHNPPINIQRVKKP